MKDSILRDICCMFVIAYFSSSAQIYFTLILKLDTELPKGISRLLFA